MKNALCGDQSCFGAAIVRVESNWSWSRFFFAKKKKRKTLVDKNSWNSNIFTGYTCLVSRKAESSAQHKLHPRRVFIGGNRRTVSLFPSGVCSSLLNKISTNTCMYLGFWWCIMSSAVPLALIYNCREVPRFRSVNPNLAAMLVPSHCQVAARYPYEEQALEYSMNPSMNVRV